MNKTMKILCILMVAIMLVSVATPVRAYTDDDEYYSGDKFNAGSIVKSIDNAANNNISQSSELNTMAGKVVALIRNIAVFAGVILLSVIGVKFMMGSAEEKAEYKKSLIPLVVGIVVVMAASQIITMIFDFVAP